MRFLLAAVTVATLCGVAAARAETHLFIVANNPDGYGVDRCLASGARCGHLIATAYCRSRAFARAVSFRKIARSDITGAIPHDGSACCPPDGCADFIAITCAR